MQTLRNATDLGWQAEQLIPLAVGRGSFTGAEDPAAVLLWRIEQHLDSHEPPAHVAEPHTADINRERSIIEQTAPRAAVEDPQWNRVWRHAAAGAHEELDAMRPCAGPPNTWPPRRRRTQWTTTATPRTR